MDDQDEQSNNSHISDFRWSLSSIAITIHRRISIPLLKQLNTNLTFIHFLLLQLCNTQELFDKFKYNNDITSQKLRFRANQTYYLYLFKVTVTDSRQLRDILHKNKQFLLWCFKLNSKIFKNNYIIQEVISIILSNDGSEFIPCYLNNNISFLKGNLETAIDVLEILKFSLLCLGIYCHFSTNLFAFEFLRLLSHSVLMKAMVIQ